MQQVIVVQVPAPDEPDERERRPGPSTIATAAARFIDMGVSRSKSKQFYRVSVGNSRPELGQRDFTEYNQRVRNGAERVLPAATARATPRATIPIRSSPPQIQQYKNHEIAFPDTRGLRQVSRPPVRNTCLCLRRARVWHSCFSAITNSC
jgi:hypothetical protein